MEKPSNRRIRIRSESMGDGLTGSDSRTLTAAANKVAVQGRGCGDPNVQSQGILEVPGVLKRKNRKWESRAGEKEEAIITAKPS